MEEIKDKEINDDTNIGNKKNEHKNRIILEFHGNENEFINKLFQQTLEKIKNYRENPEKSSKIKNFYEVNKTEKDIDIGVENEKNKVKKYNKRINTISTNANKTIIKYIIFTRKKKEN